MSSIVPWQKAAAVFHEHANEYDGWYEGSLLFDIELAAIKDLEILTPGPRLEVGVGPGRFAQRLGVSFGIDPALAPLRLAQKRQVSGCQAIGENLPFKDRSVATVYLLFTLCFLADPGRVLTEISRCLQDNGHLILGMVPGSGPWGQSLNQKKKANHPFYQHARFYEVDQVREWLTDAGLTTVEIRSSLYQRPNQVKKIELSQQGIEPGAGFVLLAARKMAKLS